MNLRSPATLSLALFLLVATANATPPDQPNMQAARTSLQQARAALQRAEHNKGGHRAKAIQLINSAITEVNRGIAFDRRNNHAQVLTFEETTIPDQPNMRAALEHLQNAKNRLQQATNDKGGHRAKAIDLCNQAIDEVKAGIAAAS